MVDDSEDSRDVTEAALLSAGYDNIVATTSGRETLKFLDVGRTSNDAAPVDIMLLDIVMPEMDGIEVCTHVRNDTRYADLPIIMVTSVDDVSSLANALVAGANDYVAKPVNPAELTTRMRVALRRKQDLESQRARERFSVVAIPGTPSTNKATGSSARSRSIEVITPAEKNKFRARLQNERTKLMAIQAKLGSPASSQESQDFEELQVVVHKLAGAAGIFGFDGVSQSATQLEELIIDTKSGGSGGAERIAGQLAGLLSVIEPECHALEESKGS
jgi:DNA-binding response OmpR family regulator/HPt (histidine-containing phosphotransfer) domain-containing protein